VHFARHDVPHVLPRQRADERLRHRARRIIDGVGPEVRVVAADRTRVVRRRRRGGPVAAVAIALHELRGEVTGRVVVQQRDRVFAERWFDTAFARSRAIDSRVE
jgi:hypothetical protein